MLEISSKEMFCLVNIFKNRLALNLFRPLEHGVIKDTPEDRDFIAHFITHLISLSDPEEYDRVVAVIGAPGGKLC